MPPRSSRIAFLLIACWACACGDDQPDDGSAEPRDAAPHDHEAGHARDAGPAPGDAGGDADAPPSDASPADASTLDAAPDLEPPRLITTLPTDGDDNVAADLAPRLVFSEPVTFSEDALQLRGLDPARAIAFTAAAGADQTSIELTLAQPLAAPGEYVLEVGAGVTDLSGNALAPSELRFATRIWWQLGDAFDRDPVRSATDVQLALDGRQRLVVLCVEGANVYASRWTNGAQNGAFEPLGAALNDGPVLASPAAEPRIALAIDAGDAPVAAFRESGGVIVKRWDGSAWQPLGDAVDPGGGGSYAPALALTADGAPVVAFDALADSAGAAQPALRVRALAGASWQTLADLAVEARGVRLAGNGSNPFTLVYQQAAAGIIAQRWDGSGLVPLGASAPFGATGAGFAASVLPGAGGAAVTAQGSGTVRLEGEQWRALARDLGFANSSAANDRALAHAPDGTLFSAFSETPLGERTARVYLQRFDGERERFMPLGPVLNRDREAPASHPALAIGGGGEPYVAWLETAAAGGATRIFVARYNGDPAQAPFGLGERAFTATCLATAPPDGSSLLDTGCFADAAAREPVAGFVPFDVISPLWSDGAFKRRFFMLPEGTSIAYRDPGIWTFPSGTILLKEFAIEGRRGDPDSVRPVETRFLVVRDGGDWDRYSYQWNQEASDALLRPASPASPLVDFAIENESGAAAVQTHFFPSRAQCFSCHQAPGTVLGPQTAMLNRNFDYGGAVDNQLRALRQLGVFGDSMPSDALAQPSSMPDPSDTTYSTEARLRAYLHANCSSCHHPAEGMDLRISIATLDTGLCTKIVKGNVDGSVLFWRDVRRGYVGQPGVAPMPPLGTLVGNPLLEPLLTTWITDPQNPCP